MFILAHQHFLFLFYFLSFCLCLLNFLIGAPSTLAPNIKFIEREHGYYYDPLLYDPTVATQYIFYLYDTSRVSDANTLHHNILFNDYLSKFLTGCAKQIGGITTFFGNMADASTMGMYF